VNRRFAPILGGLVAWLVVVAGLAGCGGDDETTTGYPAGVSRPIAKVEFLRQADQICQSTNARVEAAGDELIGGRRDPPPGQVRRIVLGIVIPALQAEVDAIGALGAPAGDERDIERILAATRDGMQQLRTDPLSALDGPPPGLREAGRLAAAYGSAACDARQGA
jgi:hypothetical protein